MGGALTVRLFVTGLFGVPGSIGEDSYQDDTEGGVFFPLSKPQRPKESDPTVQAFDFLAELVCSSLLISPDVTPCG